MDIELVITVIVAVIGSNALWGFIQFLMERKDKKDDCSKKIMDMIEKLDKKIDKIDNEAQEREAITARVRILKFMDELLEGRKHTKDAYDQVMTDITNYNKYCSTNPDFKNNQTEATIEYINKDYQIFIICSYICL